VPGEHRLNMCRLATESSDWLRCVMLIINLGVYFIAVVGNEEYLIGR